MAHAIESAVYPAPEFPLATPTSTPTQKPPDSMRETVESIVIAFILAFTFRAYVVEAFVIPTGSMAPTLLGRNVRVNCRQCGYTFKADPADQDVRRNQLDRSVEVFCPMCLFGNRYDSDTRLRAGDRILVQKYIFSIAEPRRWDVVVFKNPLLPTQNFIKRLVGLPDQSLAVIEGNIYWKHAHAGPETWQIARKMDRPKVQDAAWQMIYDSAHVPLDDGAKGAGRKFAWRVPWVPKEEKHHWRFEALPTYTHESVEAGTLRFDFRHITRPSRNMAHRSHWYPYNQLRDMADNFREPIEDIRISAGFQAHEPGLAIRMATTARLEHTDKRPSLKSVELRIADDGRATLEKRDLMSGAVDVLRSTAVKPLGPGVTHHVSMQHVDQEISVWIDGERVDSLLYRYELDIETLKQRDPLSDTNQYPHIEITVEGAPVDLHRIQLQRDLFYSSIPKTGNQTGRGTIFKRGAGGGYQGEPITLVADQFYCLGDNSPMSQDSRYWKVPNDWIRYLMLADVKQPEGIVPRKLMMGKAFFVYFPAPLGFGPGTPPVPNFSEMRFIH